MKKNPLFFICLAGTLLLAAGVVLFPRYLSRSLDARSLGHVQVAKRGQFSFLEMNSDSTAQIAEAFRYLNKNNDNLTLITSLENTGAVSEELKSQVYQEAFKAADAGLLPWIDDFSSGLRSISPPSLPRWGGSAYFARYYSLTYAPEENPNVKEMLNFWYICFAGTDYEYYFVVNAVSGQIYYAELYNDYTDQVVDIYDKMVPYDIYETEKPDSETKVSSVKLPSTGAAAEAWGLDGEISDSAIEYLSAMSDLFFNGCTEYYDPPDDAQIVTWPDLNNKLATVVLTYGDSTVYIEQIAVHNSPKRGNGIAVGFQELADRIDYLHDVQTEEE